MPSAVSLSSEPGGQQTQPYLTVDPGGYVVINIPNQAPRTPSPFSVAGNILPTSPSRGFLIVNPTNVFNSLGNLFAGQVTPTPQAQATPAPTNGAANTTARPGVQPFIENGITNPSLAQQPAAQNQVPTRIVQAGFPIPQVVKDTTASIGNGLSRFVRDAGNIVLDAFDRISPPRITPPPARDVALGPENTPNVTMPYQAPAPETTARGGTPQNPTIINPGTAEPAPTALASRGPLLANRPALIAERIANWWQGTPQTSSINPWPEWMRKTIFYAVKPYGTGRALNENSTLAKTVQDFWAGITTGKHAFTEYRPMRVDAWALYMGLPQPNGTLSLSQFRPSRGTVTAGEYYKINDFLQNIMKSPQYKKFAAEARITDPNDLSGAIKYLYSGVINAPNHTVLLRDNLDNDLMGTYVLSMGQDANGIYLAYFDDWKVQSHDWNPNDIRLGSIEGKVGLGGTPVKFYDRFYIRDTKTFALKNVNPANSAPDTNLIASGDYNKTAPTGSLGIVAIKAVIGASNIPTTASSGILDSIGRAIASIFQRGNVAGAPSAPTPPAAPVQQVPNVFALADPADVAALNKYLVKNPLGLVAGKLEAGQGEKVVQKIGVSTNRWDTAKHGEYGQHIANVLKAAGDPLASYNAATQELTLSRGLRVQTVTGLERFARALRDQGVTFGLQNAFRDEAAQKAASSDPKVVSDHMLGFAADADLRCANCSGQLDLEKRIMKSALEAEVQQIDMYGFGVRASSLGPQASTYAVHVGWSPFKNGGVESTGAFANTHRNGYLGAQVGQPGTLSGATAKDAEAQALWKNLNDASRVPEGAAPLYAAIQKQDGAQLASLLSKTPQTQVAVAPPPIVPAIRASLGGPAQPAPAAPKPAPQPAVAAPPAAAAPTAPAAPSNIAARVQQGLDAQDRVVDGVKDFFASLASPATPAAQPAPARPRTVADVIKDLNLPVKPVANPGWSFGPASTYGYRGDTSAGSRTTASGAYRNDGLLSVAHKTLPFGTILQIERTTSNGTKYTVFAVVNNRGPYIAGRVLDLVPATSKALGLPGDRNSGAPLVRYRIIAEPDNVERYGLGRIDYVIGLTPEQSAQLSGVPAAPKLPGSTVAEKVRQSPNVVKSEAGVKKVAEATKNAATDLKDRTITAFARNADGLGPALPPQPIAPLAQREQRASQMVVDLKKANPSISDVDLAAQLFYNGLEYTNTFEGLRTAVARSLAKGTSQSVINKAYTPGNAAIGKKVAELQKPTAANPTPKVTSYTRGPNEVTQQRIMEDYLWSAYQRQPLKIDSSGDFTWKDITGALNARKSLRDYVIGGMNERLKLNLYYAGKAMDADGVNWSFISGYRGLERPVPVAKVMASPRNSQHFAGGHGFGNAADLGGALGTSDQTVWNWLRQKGDANGLKNHFIANDPAHVQPNSNRTILANQQRQIAQVVTQVRLAAGSQVPAAPVQASVGGGTQNSGSSGLARLYNSTPLAKIIASLFDGTTPTPVPQPAPQTGSSALPQIVVANDIVSNVTLSDPRAAVKNARVVIMKGANPNDVATYRRVVAFHGNNVAGDFDAQVTQFMKQFVGQNVAVIFPSLGASPGKFSGAFYANKGALAKQFLAALDAEVKKQTGSTRNFDDAPVVFQGHSAGGIVVREVLRSNGFNTQLAIPGSRVFFLGGIYGQSTVVAYAKANPTVRITSISANEGTERSGVNIQQENAKFAKAMGVTPVRSADPKSADDRITVIVGLPSHNIMTGNPITAQAFANTKPIVGTPAAPSTNVATAKPAPATSPAKPAPVTAPVAPVAKPAPTPPAPATASVAPTPTQQSKNWFTNFVGGIFKESAPTPSKLGAPSTPTKAKTLDQQIVDAKAKEDNLAFDLKRLYNVDSIDKLPPQIYPGSKYGDVRREQYFQEQVKRIGLEMQKTQADIRAAATQKQRAALQTQLVAQQKNLSSVTSARQAALDQYRRSYADELQLTKAKLTNIINTGNEQLTRRLGNDWRSINTNSDTVAAVDVQEINSQKFNEDLLSRVNKGTFALKAVAEPRPTLSSIAGKLFGTPTPAPSAQVTNPKPISAPSIPSTPSSPVSSNSAKLQAQVVAAQQRLNTVNNLGTKVNSASGQQKLSLAQQGVAATDNFIKAANAVIAAAPSEARPALQAQLDTVSQSKNTARRAVNQISLMGMSALWRDAEVARLSAVAQTAAQTGETAAKQFLASANKTVADLNNTKKVTATNAQPSKVPAAAVTGTPSPGVEAPASIVDQNTVMIAIGGGALGGGVLALWKYGAATWTAIKVGTQAAVNTVKAPFVARTSVPLAPAPAGPVKTAPSPSAPASPIPASGTTAPTPASPAKPISPPATPAAPTPAPGTAAPKPAAPAPSPAPVTTAPAPKPAAPTPAPSRQNPVRNAVNRATASIKTNVAKATAAITGGRATPPATGVVGPMVFTPTSKSVSRQTLEKAGTALQRLGRLCGGTSLTSIGSWTRRGVCFGVAYLLWPQDWDGLATTPAATTLPENAPPGTRQTPGTVPDEKTPQGPVSPGPGTTRTPGGQTPGGDVGANSGSGSDSGGSGGGIGGIGEALQSALKALQPILPQLMEKLFGPKEKKPEEPKVPSVELSASPTTVNASSTSRLSWSGKNIASCTVLGPGNKKLTSGGASGAITTPSLTRSTEFGIACSGSDGKSITSAVVTVKVNGDTKTPIPVIFPDGTSVSGAGSSVSSQLQQSLQNGQGTQGTQGTQSGQQGTTNNGGNEAPVTPPTSGHDQKGNAVSNWCDPNLPIDAFTECLCNLEPGTCRPWKTTP